MNKRPACPHCNNLLVQPVGSSKSILLIGDYPGFEDVRTGRCLSDATANPYMKFKRVTPKDILEAELVRVGIQLSSCRYTNLWQHGKNEKECDVNWHINKVAEEMKGKSYVLLMGSDASRAFTGESSSDASGLKFKLKAFPKTLVMVAPNPATLISGNVGEFRLALSRFKKEMK